MGMGMGRCQRLASFRPWRLLSHNARCRPRHALLDSIALIMPDTVTTRRSTTKTCFSALRSEREQGVTGAHIRKSVEAPRAQALRDATRSARGARPTPART